MLTETNTSVTGGTIKDMAKEFKIMLTEANTMVIGSKM